MVAFLFAWFGGYSHTSLQLPLPTLDVSPPDCTKAKSLPLPRKLFDCFAGAFHVPLPPVQGVTTLNETLSGDDPGATVRFRSWSSPEVLVPNVPVPETNVGSGPLAGSRLIGKTGCPFEPTGPSTFADPSDCVLLLAFVIVNVSDTTEPPGSADVSHVPGVADCARQTVYCLIPDEGGLADPAGVNAMAMAARAVTTTASRRRRDGRPSRVNRSSFISFLPQIDATSHIGSADPSRTPSVGRNLQVRIYNAGARRRFEQDPRNSAPSRSHAPSPGEPKLVVSSAELPRYNVIDELRLAGA